MPVKLAKPKLETIFVYGTLKQGFRLHGEMEGCRYQGTGFTVDDGLSLYRLRTPTAFPVLLRAIDDEPRASVQGEVYRLTEERLKRLDAIEGNLYKRRLGPVRFQYPLGSWYKTLAWIYYGDRNFWNDKLIDKDIIPCPIHITHKSDFRYFLFQKNHQHVVRSGTL